MSACPLCGIGKHEAALCPLEKYEPPTRKYTVDAAHWARDWQVYESLGLTFRKDLPPKPQETPLGSSVRGIAFGANDPA